MESKLSRACPICGSLTGSKLDDIRFTCEEYSVLPDKYNIVCCDHCGFTFADMEASQQLFDEYYKKQNIYAEAEDLRGMKVVSNPYFDYIFGLVDQRIDKAARVIDIGCGGGQLLDYLAMKGYSCLHGLDPSTDSVANIRKRGYVGILGSVFDQIAEENRGCYDLVISTMVAEHIYDLNTYVWQLKRYARNNGYILVTVPAVEGFACYICDKPNYFNQEHINFFSRVSIQNLFGKYGLQLANQNVYREGEEEACLYLLFRNTEEEHGFVKDKIGAESIAEYLHQYSAKQQELSAKLEKVMSSDKKIVFWGSGQFAKQIIAGTPEIADRIAYFVDNNTQKQGCVLAGKKIVSPDTLFAEDADRVLVCICSMKNGAEIRTQIKAGLNCDTLIL